MIELFNLSMPSEIVQMFHSQLIYVYNKILHLSKIQIFSFSLI